MCNTLCNFSISYFIIFICKKRQITMVILIDLGKLDNLIKNLIDLADQSREILNGIIAKKFNSIQNSNYMEMVARCETDNKNLNNFKAFPIPLMIVGCNIVKFSVI